jgi:hypothetical protein
MSELEAAAMHVRRYALVAAVICVLAGPVARAERVTFTTGPFLVTCTSSGQLCDPPQVLTVGDPAKRIRIRKITYEVSEGHCSAGRLRVALDGTEVTRLRFAAARERVSKRKKLRLAPGSHLFEFRFEGKTGGCNTGAVGSWAGMITLKGRR